MILTGHDLAQLEGPPADPRVEASALVVDAADVVGGRQELARVLGVAPSTLMYWINRGRMPGAKHIAQMLDMVHDKKGARNDE